MSTVTKKSSSHNVHKQFMLVRELLVLNQLTTISIYIEIIEIFFGTDENDEKMMTLGNIMQFRNIYTSHFTSHLCTSLDMDHHVVISSLPVTTPFIPASSHPFKT